MYDPNAASNSMLEWSKRALAKKQMIQGLRSAGEQPWSAGTSGIGLNLGPKGSRNNPWLWWESDGEQVKPGDYVYERPAETGTALLTGTDSDKWRTMDNWREQQAAAMPVFQTNSVGTPIQKPVSRDATSGYGQMETSRYTGPSGVSGSLQSSVAQKPVDQKPTMNDEEWFSSDPNTRARGFQQIQDEMADAALDEKIRRVNARQFGGLNVEVPFPYRNRG